MRAKLIMLLILVLGLAACQPNTTLETLSATGTALAKSVNAPTVAPPSNTAPVPTAQPAPIDTSAPPTLAPASPTLAPANTATAIPLAVPTNTPVPSGLPLTLISLRMSSATAGWGVGQVAGDTNDHVVRTANGGFSWADVTPAGQTGKVVPAFLTAQSGWAVYAPRDITPGVAILVWRTTNGGATWAASAPLDTSGGDYFDPSNLVFVDAQHGWLMGHAGAGMSHDYIIMFATSDGGATWTRVVDPIASTLAMACYKNGLAFANTTVGWVTGDCGGVVPGAPYFQKTTDGGNTWAAQNLPAPGDAPGEFNSDSSSDCGTYSLAFTSASAGALVVRCVDYTASPAVAKSWLYTTSDAGVTWAARPLPTPYGNLYFFNSTTGWWEGFAASDSPSGVLYQTTDGGATWVEGKKLNWSGQFSFVSPQAGWGVAQAGSAYALVQTTTAGQKWAEIKPVITP
jgi:photosystem II stability/assembly factor-like uncharacterized protein